MSENRVVITGDANQAIAEYERLYVAGVGSMQRLASAGDVFLRAVGTSTARHASDLAAVPAQLAAIGEHYDRLRVSATSSLQQLASAGNTAFRNVASSSTQLAAVSDEFVRVRDTGTASLQQLQSAAQRATQGVSAASSTAVRAVGTSAAQQAQALRMVPAQLTDIVVSLQAGQAPLTVLLQQGGQLRDMFGSSGAAARGLASYVVSLVNPYSLLAAAVGVTALAYNQGSKEADAYRAALVSTGGAAGATVGQLSDAARDISKAVGTKAAAAEAVAALAGTGQVGVENLRQFGQEAVEAQRLLGKSIGDTVKDYAELGKAPVQASEKLNEQYHYLTASTYEQIAALERQGRTEEAGELAQKAYSDAMAGRAADIKANLGLMERAWQGVTDWAKKGWDAMLDIGRSDSLGDKLEKAKERLEKAKRARFTFAGGGADGKAELDTAQQAVDLLNKQAAAEAGAANEKADNQKAEEALIAWKKEGLKYLSKEKQLEEEIVAIRNNGKKARLSPAEIDKRIEQVKQEKYGNLNNAPLAALEAQRNLEKEVLAGRLADLDSNHRQRLVGEQEYITAKRDLQLQELAGEIKVAQKQAELAGGKADLAERAKYLGALAVLQQRRKNIIAQADDATAELATGPAKDLKVKGDSWDRATAGEQANLREEIALYGQAAEARKIAAAQTRVQVEAQQLLDAWTEKGHVATDKEKDKLAALVVARQKNIGAIMGEQQALAGAEQLRAENERYAAEALGDPRARAQALLDGEAKVWRQRIQLAGDGTAAQKKLQSEFNTWYANQSQKVVLDVDVARATELLKIVEAVDESTKSAAAGMAASFGRVGAAVGGLTTALSGYARTQAAIAAQLASSTKDAGGDTTKIAKANALAAQQSAQAQVKSYGDMAGAAKGFFKENSTGYKVLEGTEKAFRAYEMVMAVQNMVAKSGLVAEFTSLFVASKATETAAEGASTGASVGMAGAQASAWGVTAVVKAIASLPFPANLVAGAATLAAVVAIGAKIAGSVGGGSADTTAQDRQKVAGTGSILGDSTAKSDSIARSVELAAANSSIELNHTAGMLASLRNIESSISGLGNLLVRNSGLTGELAPNSKGSAYELGSSKLVTGVLGGAVGLVVDKITGGLVGKITGTILGSIFGGKVTTLDTGVTVGKTSLGSALAGGVQASQYTDTKKSGGWFSSDKYNTQLASLGSEANDQFTKVIRGLASSVTEAGKLLGVGGDDFVQHLNEFVVDIGKISLKGLTGDEIQKQLETVFAKVGDDLAQFGVAGLGEFQKVGEGYFETLSRVASNYANLDSILAASGGTFGQVGLASIKARENFIELAGGIDKLATNSQTYTENFLTKAEQLAPVQKYVTEQLAALGFVGLDTREKFKQTAQGLVSSGALATEAGAKQYAGLMDLAAAFSQVYAATLDLTMSEQEIADQRKELQDQYDELTMTSAQLRDKEALTIAASNKPLWEKVQAELASKAAVEESNSILELQAQMFEASGDKAAAAAVLLKQHETALVGLSPALKAATQATWDAQAAAKAQADALAISNGILANEAAYYEAVGDKASAAAIAQKQWLATLAAMEPELRASATAAHDAVAAQKAANDAAKEASAILDLQERMYVAQGDTVSAAMVVEKQHELALVGMTQAIRDASIATWAAEKEAGARKNEEERTKALEKERTDALVISNGILANQASYYEAIGDKVGAASVAQQQWLAELVEMEPALQASAVMAHNAQLAEKERAEALSESNALLSVQAQTYAATGDAAAAAAVLAQQQVNALVGLSPALAEATQAMWAAQKAAEQKKRTDDLTLELLNAQGKAQEALNMQRRAELSALSATEQAIKQQTYAAIDRAKTSSLQMELLSAQGNDAEVKRLQRLAELAQLSASDQVIKQATYAALDKAEADKAATTAAQAMAQAQYQAAQSAQQAADALKSAWKSVNDTIFDEVAKIQGLVDGNGAQTLAGAQSAFAIATAQARAGDQEAAKQLPALSKAMLDLAEANAVTAFDLRLARAQAAASLYQTGSMIGAKNGIQVPSFDVGTDYVSRTGLALIHEGEKITPAASNRPFTPVAPSRSNTPTTGGMEAIVAELRASREENRILQDMVSELIRTNTAGHIAIVKSSNKGVDVLEGAVSGQRPIPVKVVA